MLRRGRQLRVFEVVLGDVLVDHPLDGVHQQRRQGPENNAVHVTERVSYEDGQVGQKGEFTAVEEAVQCVVTQTNVAVNCESASYRTEKKEYRFRVDSRSGVYKSGSGD